MTEQAIQIATPAATKPGYKHTPLGWIPEEWGVKELGDVINYKKGFPFKAENYKASGTRIIRVSDTSFEGIKPVGQVFINELDAILYEDYKLLTNDIIIQTVGSRPPLYDSMVGKTIIVPKKFENCLLNQNAVRIRVKNGDNYFLYCWLRTKRYFDFIETLVRGNANQVSITLEELFKFIIPLPNNVEQKAIAAVLSTWDKAIATTTRLIEQKQQRKKWLMQQLLTGKKRLKGFSGEWKEVRLGDVFDERVETNRGDLPLLSVGSNGVYPQTESNKRDTSNEDKSKYKRICIGDIGYNTMRLWQGRSALSLLEGIVSPAYTIVTPKKGNYTLYFSSLFQLPSIVHLFYRNSQGLVDDTLNCKFKDFSIIRVAIPESEEQTAIAAVLQAADKEIQLLQTQLQQLKEQKKGLMQVLLTGKVRVKW